MGQSHALVNGKVPCHVQVMPKRSPDAERRYEAAKKRPGVQVSMRLTEGEVSAINAKRGATARAAWIKALIKRELKSNR